MEVELLNQAVDTTQDYVETGEGWDGCQERDDLNGLDEAQLKEIQAQLGKLSRPTRPESATMPTEVGMKIDCRFKVGERQADGKKEQVTKSGTFTVKDYSAPTYTLEDENGKEYKVGEQAIEVLDPSYLDAMKKFEQALKEYNETKEELEEEAKTLKKKIEDDYIANTIELGKLEPKDQLRSLIDSGMNNVWMVGPAGAGKSTMAKDVSIELEVPYMCISCGIGTSAAEFVGYKYPVREATKFSEYYGKPSIILIDEFTALDPAVAQVLNAALANGEIETTTGLVKRHPDCIIIATSNTFGGGGSRQYVANNQLDASTIDRFVGAVIEVQYSANYESQYDDEVVHFVNTLRKCIKQNEIRKVASTRMIQAGTRLKRKKFRDWKMRLIINWTESEKNQLQEYIKSTTDKPKPYEQPAAPSNTSLYSAMEEQMLTMAMSEYGSLPVYGQRLRGMAVSAN